MEWFRDVAAHVNFSSRPRKLAIIANADPVHPRKPALPCTGNLSVSDQDSLNSTVEFAQNRPQARLSSDGAAGSSEYRNSGQLSDCSNRNYVKPRKSISLTVAAQVLPPNPPSRNPSLRKKNGAITPQVRSVCKRNVCLYTGMSNRPRGWKHTYNSTPAKMRSPSVEFNIRKWDGTSRSSVEWDGLRRDPELWLPEGDCFVHLHAVGQSRRGPAFRIPLDAIITANCQPLLERFLVQDCIESPFSDSSSHGDSGYFGEAHRAVELYIPAPPTTERGEAYHHHMATRNFFAWICGKSLVGTQLGAALVELLRSMEEWRNEGQDNVQDIMTYMDEEGYSNLNSQPDHALAVLYFAEHFRFKDMYIDAFAHCVGMYESLIFSPGYEFISRVSRALISRSKIEMDIRLDHCGKKLSSFLHEELAYTMRGLSPDARAHLDRFRSFLNSFYVAKVGYYPPVLPSKNSEAFPKNVYELMVADFQKLYEFLADTRLLSPSSEATDDGTDVLRNITVFDARHKHSKLTHTMPLLPDMEEQTPVKAAKRMGWVPAKMDKLKPDHRMVAFSALNRATNCTNPELYDCSLVRAYRIFEKETVFPTTKNDPVEKISPIEGRKVRWIAIYTIYQTLLSTTRVPREVRDPEHVPYSLCVQSAGCPPWKDTTTTPRRPRLEAETAQRRQSLPAHILQQSLGGKVATPAAQRPSIARRVSVMSKRSMQSMSGSERSVSRVDSEIQVPTIIQRPKSRAMSISSLPMQTARRATVRRALGSLGNMPELVHPKPQRATHHEILVDGYGNGLQETDISSKRSSIPVSIAEEDESPRTFSFVSEKALSAADLSRWSNLTEEEDRATIRTLSFDSEYSLKVADSSRWSTSDTGKFPDSPTTTMSSPGVSRRSSCLGIKSTKSVEEFLGRVPLDGLGLRKLSMSSSIYSEESLNLHEKDLKPHPLRVRSTHEDELPSVMKQMRIDWGAEIAETQEELLNYLATSLA